MKDFILIITITALFSLNACGQDNKIVPKEVTSAFSQKFPNASKVKWSMENNKEWEAEFKIDNKKYSANFDIKGVWLETEYKINKNEIPASVKTTLQKEFKGYKIEESEISETALGKVYEFELEKGESELEVAIDLNGKVVKKEKN